jgi:hypothetical protein
MYFCRPEQPTDLTAIRVVRSGALPADGALVRYAPEFALVG